MTYYKIDSIVQTIQASFLSEWKTSTPTNNKMHIPVSDLGSEGKQQQQGWSEEMLLSVYYRAALGWPSQDSLAHPVTGSRLYLDFSSYYSPASWSLVSVSRQLLFASHNELLLLTNICNWGSRMRVCVVAVMMFRVKLGADWTRLDTVHLYSVH